MGMAEQGATYLHDPRAAFALLELLVVIGIIALLLSILMPVLSRAREAANSLKCEANLRMLGQAMMMHANDHRQYFPLMGAQLGGPQGTLQDTPANLGDATMQKYDYLADWGGLRPTALPAALRRIWDCGAAQTFISPLKPTSQLVRCWPCSPALLIRISRSAPTRPTAAGPKMTPLAPLT